MNIGFISSTYTAPATELRPAELNSVGRTPLSDDFSTERPVPSIDSSEASHGLRSDSDHGGAELQSGQESKESETQNAESRRETKQLQQEQEQIKQLAARDREVRAHEQAHAAVGGQYAGAPSYEFQRGPDGVRYAVGGEVPIDVSRAATPQETIQKMQVVRRAALAPAEPSPQDRRVASQASITEAKAQQELAVELRERAEHAKEARKTEVADDESVTGSEEPGSAAQGERPGFDRAPTFTPFRSALPPNDITSVLQRTILASDDTRQPGRLFDQSV